LEEPQELNWNSRSTVGRNKQTQNSYAATSRGRKEGKGIDNDFDVEDGGRLTITRGGRRAVAEERLDVWSVVVVWIRGTGSLPLVSTFKQIASRDGTDDRLFTALRRTAELRAL
jgi:hypothetical protein